ncbi:hypothetical protein CRENPOLYSF2_2050001 [Crenothrix polyspora]|uniref:Uncharacterized protein n=1 Tax=Crenothrix polyspora TaxID=360316 RepID=A0A1R4H4I6_9GAMM|nr:hypothetical protein CRENPOLYSF2_2050001 [Crenothrix polyspora]
MRYSGQSNCIFSWLDHKIKLHLLVESTSVFMLSLASLSGVNLAVVRNLAA